MWVRVSLKQKIFFLPIKLPILTIVQLQIYVSVKGLVSQILLQPFLTGEISFSKYLRGFEGQRDVTTAINTNADSGSQVIRQSK